MQLDRPQLVVTAMLACLIVAGCGRKAEERNKAAGEVLEGTISDAMIATDAVRSEPPIAPRKPGAADAKGGGKDKPKQAGDAAEPDATPTPETSPAAETGAEQKPAASEPAG